MSKKYTAAELIPFYGLHLYSKRTDDFSESDFQRLAKIQVLEIGAIIPTSIFVCKLPQIYSAVENTVAKLL
jgi:hypothetical protein